MMTLLVEIKDQVEVAQACGRDGLSGEQLSEFEQRYGALIEQGLVAALNRESINRSIGMSAPGAPVVTPSPKFGTRN
jgi:hypothetical protein